MSKIAYKDTQTLRQNMNVAISDLKKASDLLQGQKGNDVKRFVNKARGHLEVVKGIIMSFIEEKPKCQ